MNRLLTLLFSILLIGCCDKPKLHKNGLTKPAFKITEYSIRIVKDSSNNEIQDTLSITEKKYNNNNQIINRIQHTLFDKQKMEIDYIYNGSDKIEQEIVKMSTDSLPFTVNYIYKDTLLFKSKGIVENANEKFEQLETYYYRKNNTKEKIISTQLFIDLESSDTIRNSVSKSNFDQNELMKSIETINHTNPNQNNKMKFSYDCGTLVETMEYNYKDSLTSTTKYKYQLDKFENWIRKESFENDKLNYILAREIEYK